MKTCRLSFKNVVTVVAFIAVSLVMSGCKKEKGEDFSLARVGTIAPPKWLIGTWKNNANPVDVVKVRTNDFEYGTYDRSFIDVAKSYYYRTIDGEEIQAKVKELKKDDSTYEVGFIYILEDREDFVSPMFYFKKGNVTMEMFYYNYRTESFDESVGTFTKNK